MTVRWTLPSLARRLHKQQQSHVSEFTVVFAPGLQISSFTGI